MPYVIQAGLASDIVAGAARALRPLGALVVLNLAYGLTGPENQALAAQWASGHGWALSVDRPFMLWDGVAFIFRT